MHKVSLIDYPGKIAAVIFCRGCNFRCPYCHNPELVDPKKFKPCLPEKEVYDFLRARKGKLDAVVISGGEPTVQADLVSCMKKIRKLGFLVKLDTNGALPDVLEHIFKDKLIDYVAMDVKAPLDAYSEMAGVRVDQRFIRRSIDLILQSAIPHEFRTTAASSRLKDDDILSIAREIRGAQRYVLQRFQPARTLAPVWRSEKPATDGELSEIAKRIGKTVRQVMIR